MTSIGLLPGLAAMDPAAADLPDTCNISWMVRSLTNVYARHVYIRARIIVEVITNSRRGLKSSVHTRACSLVNTE